MSLVFSAVSGTTTTIVSPKEVRLTVYGTLFQDGWTYWTDKTTVVPNTVNISFDFFTRFRSSSREHGVSFWFGYDGPGQFPPTIFATTKGLSTTVNDKASRIIGNPDGFLIAFNSYTQSIVVGWGESTVVASSPFTFTSEAWTPANIVVNTRPGLFADIRVTIAGVVGFSQRVYGNFTPIAGNYGFVGWTGGGIDIFNDGVETRVRNPVITQFDSLNALPLLICNNSRSNNLVISNNPPVLDNLLPLSNCAGAYSTRLLYSQYRGPALRVRRGTDSAAAVTDVWVDSDGYVVKLCDVSASGGVDYFHDTSLRAFLASGTLSVQRAQPADVLVVGGGGAGGAVRGGGGGAGGLLFLRNVVLESNQTYRAWVGLGGTAGSTTGENSVFESNVAFGGGFGQGGPGGSGGGACTGWSAVDTTGGEGS